jgi:hypothetical protein
MASFLFLHLQSMEDYEYNRLAASSGGRTPIGPSQIQVGQPNKINHNMGTIEVKKVKKHELRAKKCKQTAPIPYIPPTHTQTVRISSSRKHYATKQASSSYSSGPYCCCCCSMHLNSSFFQQFINSSSEFFPFYRPPVFAPTHSIKNDE